MRTKAVKLGPRAGRGPLRRLAGAFAPGSIDYRTGEQECERAIALARGMRKYWRDGGLLRFGWDTTLQALPLPAAPSRSTRSIARRPTLGVRALYSGTPV